MHRLSRVCLLLAACLLPGVATAQAPPSPEALRPGVALEQVATLPPAPVRLAYDASSEVLWVLLGNGSLYRLASPFRTPELAYTPDAHDTPAPVLGLSVAQDGTLYLVGNQADGATTRAVIRRGTPTRGGEHTWSTVAETEPYPRSNTPFDHNFNSVTVSPDGQWLYVNSGSRTDHGEVQDNGGRFPGVREVPLTSTIFRIPADADGLVLPNDADALEALGVVFADGVRNSFDQAFDAQGRLFGSENAGDRDDNEELNWLREGHHYGFPWRIGQSDTPMQFPGYDPSNDALLNPASIAVRQGFFYDDPDFPPPPEGVTFTEPVRNLGPDADLFRDPADGQIKDASALGIPFATFTSHRSPLGLLFDTAGALPAPYTEGGFVLSWTGPESPLLAPYGDEGADLLHLALQPDGEGLAATVTRLVRGFANPIDAVQVNDTLLVVEFSRPHRLWAVTFGAPTATEPSLPAAPVTLTVAPHPVAGTATLRVHALSTQAARVEVVDLLGRTVAVVHDGHLVSSERAFPIDLSGHPAGLYVVRVSLRDQVVSRPIVVVR